jgi:hypothetical protein
MTVAGPDDPQPGRRDRSFVLPVVVVGVVVLFVVLHLTGVVGGGAH